MNKDLLKKEKNKKALAYIGLFIVVFSWGISPLLTSVLYQENSPTICASFIALVTFIALFFICIPHLKKINSTCLKIAILTGIFTAVANLLQKIGLMYSTPTQYAFLENLSCVVVPILLFIITKKKPNFFTLSAVVLCFISSFVLTGMASSTGGFGKGEILCSLAGILYGFNIALTGIYVKNIIFLLHYTC